MYTVKALASGVLWSGAMERLSNRLHLVGELLSLTHVFSPQPLGIYIGVGGQFALLSSSNRLFYGTLSYGSAIEVGLAYYILAPEMQVIIVAL